MQQSIKIGVLAFHGDVIEHILSLKKAASKLNLSMEVLSVRTKKDIDHIDGLIIPGGESTTLYKLCEREGMLESIKKIKNIFGTCAGAILMAKAINNKTKDQKTLELMDIEIDRNAYGRQTDSFEKPIETSLGNLLAVFIRAPKIKSIGKSIIVIAKDADEIIACEQNISGCYYLALCFHPELTSTLFHEHFLKKISLNFTSTQS
ncbi:pyridoxal 5'-phosphate synthase glutaminase subunit PdxT [Candidatus Gottesmanbacteria bacterium]|nr:pyridoxal 5'-phosphate synthase glutaminase subunit PdxT [Candidatus Gottesmanbacteria bacterium]